MQDTTTHIIDQCFVLASCLLMMLFTGSSESHVVSLLVAIACASAFELTRSPWRSAFWIAYLAIGFFLPTFGCFLPAALYDGLRYDDESSKAPRLIIIAMVLGLFFYVCSSLSIVGVWLLIGLCLLASVLALRTSHNLCFAQQQRKRHDELRETSLRLAARNHDLREQQDYEVALATMAERGRIARDIHDNVGHLLTRGVLQTDAALVLHGEDKAYARELERIKTTMQEALTSVRSSVHALHDESLDINTQIDDVLSALEGKTLHSEIVVDAASPAITLCLLAVLREAIANINRHSNATEVTVRLLEFPALYSLTVHDNGKLSYNHRQTSDGANDQRSTGMGLQSIEERVTALHGTFRAGFDPSGFIVFVSLPKSEVELLPPEEQSAALSSEEPA